MNMLRHSNTPRDLVVCKSIRTERNRDSDCAFTLSVQKSASVNTEVLFNVNEL